MVWQYSFCFSIHGVAVCDNAAYFHGHASGILQQLGIHVHAEDVLDIVEGYKGEGYGITTEEGLGRLTTFVCFLWHVPLDVLCDVIWLTGKLFIIAIRRKENTTEFIEHSYHLCDFRIYLSYKRKKSIKVPYGQVLKTTESQGHEMCCS